ncbi:MAG: 30S ribosomal protein S20 [Patescibacteria group bacterium]|nr:30S ribosomal protein S20 [Patescibacteria group bacterium]
MPILPNAKKALRASSKKAEFNRTIKSRYRTTRKKMEQNPTQENLDLVHAAIDKAVKKNIFHKNKGARLKSQTAKMLAAAEK